jgi:hypothetical protein
MFFGLLGKAFSGGSRSVMLVPTSLPAVAAGGKRWEEVPPISFGKALSGGS